MSRRILFLTLTLAIIAALSEGAAAQSCVVADPSGTQLNVRTAPNGPVVAAVPNGLAVRIVASGELNGKPWVRVVGSGGRDLGWVFRSYLSCEDDAAAVEAAAPAGRACRVADPTGTPLNVRAAPRGEVRRTLPNGQAVRVVRTSAPDNGARWALVAEPAGSEIGWVLQSYLSCGGPAPPSWAPGAPAAGPRAAAPGAAPPSAVPATAPPAVVANVAPPAAAAAPLPAGKRVALVIGNSAYRFANVLPNPANDAGDMAAGLRAIGFEVVEGKDLDFQGLRTSVRAFADKLAGADVALFFYAGHGVQVAGRNYLVPVDAKLDNAGSLDIDALDVDAVIRTMEADQRANIVILDACRDNPFTRSLQRSLGATRSASVGQGLAQIRTGSGTLVAFATDPGNVALDGDGTRNSPFTSALLRHMREPGVEIESMMKRVRQDVVRATKGKQTPWSNSSLTGDVFLAKAPGG